MRRRKQALDREDCILRLNLATSGVLSLLSPDGYPYGVPLSFAYSEEKDAFYFHSAIEGHKLDAIKKSEKASFTVVLKDDVLAEKFTTLYLSIIAFGSVSIVKENVEKRYAIDLIAEKYSSSVPLDLRNKEIESSFDRFVIIKLKVERMSGKKGSYLC